MSLFYAVIDPRSPRFDRFRRYVGGDSVLVLPRPACRPNLIGTGEDVLCYFADLEALGPERLERLIAAVVEDWGGTAEEARDQLARLGFPVIAEDVVLCLDPEPGRLAFGGAGREGGTRDGAEM